MPRQHDRDNLVFPRSALEPNPEHPQPLDPLTRLLRVILYQKGVTGNDFVLAHSSAHVRKYGSQILMSQSRHNIRKAVGATHVTWRTFRLVITQLLRLPIVRLSITVRREDGQEVTYCSDADINTLTVPDDDY